MLIDSSFPRKNARRVTWSVLAASEAMGQQSYETAIQAALLEVADPEEWAFRRVTLRSVRSALAGDRRYPAALLNSAPLPLASAIGAFSYWGSGLVHRLDLRLPPARRPEVITVHDLPPLRFSDEGVMPKSAGASARRARIVICPSQFAASEVRHLLGVQRVCVIPYGLNAIYKQPPALSELELQRMGLGRRYIVHAAGATARKNLPALASAWKIITSQIPDVWLALCGPRDQRRTRLFDGVPRTRLLGRLEPAVVAALMAGAAAVVVPSLYEGFGLPALEGMACAVPVVAANAGALPEVCGNAAHLVEPDAEGLAQGLWQVLSDANLSDRLRKDGPVRAGEFSWARAAREHLKVYRQVLEEEGRKTK